MTLTEARKAVRYLTRAGWREPEIIKYERSWRVYVSDTRGGRIHLDSMESVRERLA